MKELAVSPYKDENGKPFKLKAPFYTSGLFFPMKTERDEDGVRKHYVIVKDDTVQAEPKTLKIPAENLFTFFQEKQDMRLYDYFQAQIRLQCGGTFRLMVNRKRHHLHAQNLLKGAS